MLEERLKQKGGDCGKHDESTCTSHVISPNLNEIIEDKGVTYTGVIDTISNVTYSLVAGIILDYSSGLDARGILASRASATVINSATGGLYGTWRDFVFRITRTTKESGHIKKTIADLIAFNTFQVPVYALALTIGSLVQDEDIDYEKVLTGCRNLAIISPLIGPTLGWYMNRIRNLFGIKTPAERASYTKNQK